MADRDVLSMGERSPSRRKTDAGFIPGTGKLGFLKGKSAVRVHRELLHERRMTGLQFWATGYWVSTVGRDEAAVRRYIRQQEHWDQGQG